MTETEPTERSSEPLIKLWKQDLRTHARKLSDQQIHTLLQVLRNPDSPADIKHAARETLVLSCLRLAFTLAAREHIRFKLPFEDAVSVANLAAIEAVDSITRTFDPAKGGLHAYAKVAIKRALEEASHQSRHIADVPFNQHKVKTRINRARREEADASPEQIADATGLSLNAVIGSERVPTQSRVSLSEPVVKNGMVETDCAEAPLTYEDILADTKALTGEELLATDEGRELLRRIIRALCTKDQYECIVRAYGLDGDPMTELEVARALKLSRVATHNHLARGRKRLQQVEGLRSLLRFLLQPSRYTGRTPIEPLARKDTKPHMKAFRRANSKLDAEQVKQIRQLLAAGQTARAIGKQFQVSETTVLDLKHGRKWSWVH
jgi:RNA polymerase sigma factor (sigma-70 family)